MRTFADTEEAMTFIQTLAWGNAAGCCKEERRVRTYAQAGVAHVTYGSITAQQRNGNAGDNFGFDPRTGDALNAWGIPDPGIDVHLDHLPRLKQIVNDNNAQLWVSISAGDAFDPQEYHDMAKRLVNANCVNGIEGNFSCPNMVVGGKPKPVVCYDLPRFDEGVEALSTGAGSTPIKVKIAPITEASILRELVDACIQHDVAYIVAANTIGNCYLEDLDGKPLIAMMSGGLSGPGLRPLINGMLRLMNPWLAGTHTKVIAVGGIETGGDAYNYLRLGAHGFAFNTALTKANYDPAIISNMILGLKDGDHILQPGLVDYLISRGLPD